MDRQTDGCLAVLHSDSCTVLYGAEVTGGDGCAFTASNKAISNNMTTATLAPGKGSVTLPFLRVRHIQQQYTPA